MRERFDRNVAAVEHEANKMARVANRASPLMETLGGCAIAIALIYAGYRVVVVGATPGQFFSFITAFLLAYEPAKRLARLNIELNSGLVGVRILYEIIDCAPDRSARRRQAGACTIKTPRLAFDDVHFAYRGDESVLRGMSFVAEPGKLTALVGPSGGGKSTIFNLILRFYDFERGKIVDRRAGHHAGVAPLAAPAHRLCRPGRVPVPRHHPREHRLRQTGRQRGRDRGRRQGRLCARLHHGVPARLRHAGRRARPAIVRRPAPAHRHCARADQERAHHPARRGDRRARFRIRVAGARGHGPSVRAAAPRSPSRTACTRCRTPTASSWSRTAAWSNPAATTSCCARAAATPRSTGCSSRSRSRGRRLRR